MARRMVSALLALVMSLLLVVPPTAYDANSEKGSDGGAVLVETIKGGLTNVAYNSIELDGKTLAFTTGENFLGQTVTITESEDLIVIAIEIDEETIESVEIERSAQREHTYKYTQAGKTSGLSLTSIQLIE